MKMDNNSPLRIFLHASFQGVKESFVFAFDNTDTMVIKKFNEKVKENNSFQE